MTRNAQVVLQFRLTMRKMPSSEYSILTIDDIDVLTPTRCI